MLAELSRMMTVAESPPALQNALKWVNVGLASAKAISNSAAMRTSISSRS